MRRWGKDESHSEVLAQNPGSGGRGPWKFQRQDKALYREVHVDPWAFLLCAVGGLGLPVLEAGETICVFRAKRKAGTRK